jgi:hypothetical protein
MPSLKFSENMSFDQLQSDKLLSGLSQLFTKVAGKPERYVMADLAGDKAPLYCGGKNFRLIRIVEKAFTLSCFSFCSANKRHDICRITEIIDYQDKNFFCTTLV